jgi:S-DNA-T family DNA segregation ATPase FtsK/SpoIIIE
LIDPKRGVDYAWARRLPQLRTGIIDDQEEARALLERLVDDMDERYEAIAAEGCRNIGAFNRKVSASRRMPRVVIFFDEVANWMQDDEFKSTVDGLINKIATKSRAAGFHLFMIYQRADNQVMTMQLRTNLGNKLILRLGDEGSSKIALNERGAERLLGKGHLIAKLQSDEKVYLQVPYIGDEEVEELAAAVIATWQAPPPRVA